MRKFFIYTVFFEFKQTPGTLSKLSLDLRLLTELVLCGVLNEEGLGLIISALRIILSSDKDAQCIIPVLAISKAFAYELAGIVPSHIQQLCNEFSMTLPPNDLIQSSKQFKIQTMLREYISSISSVWSQVLLNRRNSLKRCSHVFYFLNS